SSLILRSSREAAASLPSSVRSTRPSRRAGGVYWPIWDAPMSGSPQADIDRDVGTFVRLATERLSASPSIQVHGKLTRVAGLVLEATGLKLPVGSSCTIAKSGGPAVEAEVVGFSGDRLFLMPITDIHGLTPGASVTLIEPAQPRPRLHRAQHPFRRAADH